MSEPIGREGRMMRTGFFVLVVLTVFLSSIGTAGTLYGTVNYGGPSSTLVEIDPNTGAVVQTIGAVGHGVIGLSFDPTTGRLYGTTRFYDPFTGLIERGRVLRIPSAHAEGKLMFPAERLNDYLDALEREDQVVFRYVDRDGEPAGYPFNPNGSPGDIAGICNPEGNVFGMMPHPERVFFRTTHADWTRAGEVDAPSVSEIPRAGDGDTGAGDGRALFESVLRYVERRF